MIKRRGMNYSQENKKKEKINNLINKNITKTNKKKNLNSSFSDSKTNISLDENSESLKKRKIFNNEGKKKNEYSERMNTFKNIFNNEREIPKNKVINNKLKIINIQLNKMELRNKSIKRKKKKKNLVSESKDLNEKMEKGIIKNEETCLESFIDNVIRNAKENHEEEKKFVGSNDIMINKTLNIENEKKTKKNRKKEMKDKNDEDCLNVNDKIIEIFPETDMNYKNVTTNSLNNKERINENSAINLSDYINNEVDKCKNEKEDENGKAENIEIEKRVKNISKINKSFYTESECSYLEKMNKTKLGLKNDCFCYCRKGKQYNNGDINNYYNNNIDSAENKKENGDNELKNIDWLIYTIRYMDYRRLRRRFNGIRKPISKKIVFIITIFCLILISWKYFKTSYENNKFTISVEFQTTFLFFVEAIAAVIGIIIFAKFQTRLSLHWPIYASYIFIICASVILIFFEKDKPAKNSRGEHILIVYGIVQLSLIIIVKIIIFIGPLLAIYGFFCPCTEHCRILKKKMSTNKLNITVSRYNDFAGMCGNNFCCFCLCIYRSFYRIINCFYKKCSNLRFKMTKDKIKEAPFSHQLRYKGKTDIYGRPHGYGEWIEDHSYGEKLRGFWFHGYPVGPFISQEVGSGSLFVNTRVGFAACVGKDWSDVRYGVSCTECSISGHFFNDFPLTYFFNPKIEKEANGRLPTNRYDLVVKDILKENYEDILSYDLKWCFNMLKVNSGSTTEYCSNNCMISLDHVTMSLKVHNYKRLSSIKRRNNILDEINVKLVHVPKVKKNKKIHKRDKTNKYDHILKKQENDEFFYINQNKLHKNIRRLSSTNFPEINDSLQGSIHSYYTKKCSEKLDSMDDEIYLYKANKKLNSTEMHKSPYFYDYNEKSSHEDKNLKKKENKNFLSHYSSEWNINFCDMIKCSDTSSYKKKKINCNNFGKRKLNDSNHLKKICANNNNCDKNKYDIKICINNKNKYNERERHSIYNDFKKDKNYKIKENSNIKEFFLKKDSSLSSSHIYENKIKNISSASEREGFVINIRGFDKMNKNNNLDEKVKIKNNFFSDYKNVSISQRDPVEKKEKSVFFSHSEYNTFMSNDKEFFYDDLLCSKFQTQDLLGTKKHGNIDKKKSNKEIKTEEEEEEQKETKTFFQQKIESDYRGKSKKERRNKNFFKIDDNYKNKEKSQSRTKNRSKENISYKEKYPEYEIDSNKEKITNENIELCFLKNEELALDNEGKFHKETTKDEKLSENKNLFFSDIFKSFINSSIQRNSKKRASVNSCEMEGIQKSNKQKKKTLRSYKFLSDVKKNRRDSFNKTTKKMNMNKIKNFKQKGLVKKNVKQTKKNSIYITSNHKKFDKILRLKYSKKNKNERILSSLGKKMKSLNETFDNFNGPNLSPNLNRNKTIAQVFAEEDEWENYRHQHKEKIVIDGWQSLSLKRNLNFMPDEIVIYIHGYNVKLHHGCSQLAHLISFSKLPSYIQPFVFHWEGAMWGPFSALSYPVARKRSEMSILGRSFKKFIEDLINLGIKNVHLISHSCGSRLFFNGFSYCVEDNLFYNVLKNEQSKIKKDDDQKKRWGIENNDYDDNSNISNDEHSDTNTFIHNTKNSKKKKQIIVKTIILLNPDYPLDKFLEKDFFLLRTHCNHIVMYGDTRDQALTYSETWNREKCLGKRIFKLKLPLYKIHNYEDYLNLNTARNKLLTENYEEKYMMCDSVLFPHSTYTETKIKEKQKQKEGEEEEKENNNDEQKERGEEEKLNASNKMLQINKTNLNSSTYDYNEDVSFISEEISHNYLNETFLKTVEFSDTSLKAFKSKKKFKLSNAFKQIKRKWLFKKKKTSIYFNENTSNRPYSLKMKKRASKIPNQIFMKTDTVYISFDKYAWLDMDVIDTTFVETNVDFLKHSFYQVKREIIDDIREVLISNIRAHERVSRLDRRRGNVFVLRVAPAGVGSLHR